jgi:hypothetical protein
MIDFLISALIIGLLFFFFGDVELFEKDKPENRLSNCRTCGRCGSTCREWRYYKKEPYMVYCTNVGCKNYVDAKSEFAWDANYKKDIEWAVKVANNDDFMSAAKNYISQEEYDYLNSLRKKGQ